MGRGCQVWPGITVVGGLGPGPASCGMVRTTMSCGVVSERLFLKHLYKLDPLYGLLLTFGPGAGGQLALVHQRLLLSTS